MIRLVRRRRPSHRCGFAAAVCLALAAAACNQSLFDSNTEGSADGGPGGGGAAPGEDGAPDSDGGTPGEDASPPASSCPAPCVGDAFAEFSGAQGGSSGQWSYLGDLGAPNGAEYGELTFGEWNGLDAWTIGKDGPVIASCRDSTASLCAGLSEAVLLAPSSGAARPALSFRVPETAGIRLSGAVRVADGEAVDVPVDLIVSRAGRHDVILARRLRTSIEERGFEAVVPGIEGDEIVVSVASAEPTPPIGLRLFFTAIDEGEGAFPGSCQAAARFDPADPLVDGCRGATILDLQAEGSPPGTGPTVPGPAPSDRLGDARVFAEGQFLALGNSPLDYSGDFTVQFWARMDEPPLARGTTAYSDFDGDSGGVWFNVSDESPTADFCRFEPSEDALLCLTATRPTDASWHFWRIVRSTADETLRLCADGSELARTPLPADRNLTGFVQPLLGKYAFEYAYYTGSLDEVRVFSEALPCPTN